MLPGLRQRLEEWAAQRGVRLPVVPAECEQAFHMFYLILPSRESRQGLIAHPMKKLEKSAELVLGVIRKDGETSSDGETQVPGAPAASGGDR